MPYRSNLNSRDKSRAIAAVVAIHAALLFALLHISGRMDLGSPQSVLSVFDISKPPPPPPPPPSPQQQSKPKEKEGGSAPKNVESEATPVAAPEPKIETPPVQQIAASETPRQGTQTTQGADVRGPGTGAGGVGNGTGGGSGGNGPGGGGEGGIAEPPHLMTPVLSGRDIPREILDQWPRGATAFMRLRVDARGFVSECTIDHGTDVPAIDSTLCNIAHERLRFRPALNQSGQAVAGWFGYAQPAPR